MDIYYNKIISKIEILPLTTIYQLKQSIRDWLQPQGITNYNVKLVFNDNTELSPVVFKTNEYDTFDFTSKTDVIAGGKIYVSSVLSTKHIIKIKGDPKKRNKIHTTQIQKSLLPKTKKTGGRKITSKEKEYMLAKRLQQFSNPDEHIVVPTPPSRLKPITPEELARRNNNLKNADHVQTISPISPEILQSCLPKTVKLRKYQLDVIYHMLNHRGLIAAHSIGSGKTLIAATSALTILRSRPEVKLIFISPKSLIENFKGTLNKFFDNVDWSRISTYTYEKFQVDNDKGLIDGYNTYLIIDEAHRLRTYVDPKQNNSFFVSAKTVRSIMRCARKAVKVLLLTATPVVNEPYDIVNLIAILNGELNPIAKKNFYSTIYSKKGNIINKTVFDNFFNRKMSIYKRPYDETYPEVETHVVEIPMSPQYYKEYQRVELENISDLQKHVLGENDLKPFHNGIRRTVNADIEEFNSKLDWVRQHLLKFNSRKVIIFSPFISLGIKQLEKLVKDFDVKPKIGVIEGSNTETKRKKVIDDFNMDKIQILLISIGAGGLGLNLIGTRDVISMQLGWNDVETEQAMGRAIRFHSHTHLPLDERKVDIWKLILVKPYGSGGELSADQIIENITQRKNKIIIPFIEKLESLTIEK